jgi:rhodanese-related sulfurtransferase
MDTLTGAPCPPGFEPARRLRRPRAATLTGMSAATGELGIEVDPARVVEWLAEDPSLQLTDVREPYERDAGRIAGSRHISLAELSDQATSVQRDRPVVFYCRVGARSDMAAQAFRAAGYEAYSMSGGLARWAREGRPMEPEDGYVAEH